MPLNDPAHAFVPYPDVPVRHAGSGPLSGLYFGVKDLFDIAGYPTGGGNQYHGLRQRWASDWPGGEQRFHQRQHANA